MTILPTPKYENVKQKQRESFGGAGRCHQWNGSRNFLNKYLQLIVHLNMVCAVPLALEPCSVSIQNDIHSSCQQNQFGFNFGANEYCIIIIYQLT